MKGKSLEEVIVAAVLKTLGIEEVGQTDNLLAKGLDSQATVSLIKLLEDELDINFEKDELVFENFETMENIVKLIEKKN